MAAPVLVFGHSHVWSIQSAVRKGYESAVIEPRILLCGTAAIPGPLTSRPRQASQPVLNPAVLGALQSGVPRHQRSETWIASSVHGNYYNRVGMYCHDQPFDFVLPSESDAPLQQDCEVIPFGAIKAELTERCRHLTPYLRLLAEMGFKGVIVLGPPPPPRTDEHALAVLRRSAPDASAHQVTAADVRLKLWRVQNALVSAVAAESGAHYSVGDLGARATDDDGFLRPDLVKDAVHATVPYSTMLLDQVSEIVASKGDLNAH